ncbi:hypothetical protein BTH55_05170 [Lactobacillus delbrueckii subsp. bulgaricus]|nr:hypothetical protein [Lactobacillus delbrueckii subsp. bulgaricus]MBT8854135.1 hypothetical protein [Lactobacillus delbrueckii subsp. bulgaricus]MBT8857210.1 hypothetical protein [Lactobacillus delbrueckii subsp. bulgaricus]MBT8866954.1 hypothetical protein [Lactobacillus delbrueckii subsp. bulgaricus]
MTEELTSLAGDKITVDPELNKNLITLRQQSPYNSYVVTKEGKIKSTSRQNVTTILQTDPKLEGLFKYNEFTQSIEVTRDAILDTSRKQVIVPKIHIKKGALEDSTVSGLGLYIETTPEYDQVNFKKELIQDGIELIARDHAYNPITDYLNDCKKKWDGQYRLDKFFPDFLGAEDTSANRLIVHKIFEGVVAKAFDPGVKFDWVLDLVGGQGVGKTTLLQKIAPCGAYTDSFLTFTEKDDISIMRKAIIVNDDEMVVSNKSGFEVVKKFITMREFSYRPPYGHNDLTFKKHFILFRTSNEIHHLKDRSGDRRFWSILCHKDKQKHHPAADLEQDLVDQLWGEAMWWYEKEPDPFKLNEQQERWLEESRQDFKSTTALEDELAAVLDEKHAGKTKIKDQELYADIAQYRVKDTGSVPRALSGEDKNKIKKYMEHSGWNFTRGNKETVDGETHSFQAFVKVNS